MSMMTNILPHDVVIDILSRLPVKSLLRFRCVCKLWKIFFNDPSFIEMHLNHSTNNYEHVMLGSSCLYSIVDSKSSLADEVVDLDYPFKTHSTNDGFQILGSCNGLLLIITYNFLCLWNPSTKEFKKLPNTSIDYPKEWHTYCVWNKIGFGYDKIIEDYKVVLIYALNDGLLDVKVYTLGSDSWRRIKDIHIPGTLKFDYQRSYHSTVAAGKLVKGVLHWVESTSRLITYHRETDFDDDEEEEEEDKEEYSHIILSLNIEDEKFGEIQQPDFIDTKCQMNVEVLGGCLSIMCNFHNICLDIWVMKEYGVKESWIKLFTIDQPSVITCFEYLRTQGMDQLKLLFVKDISFLFIYNSKRRSAETLPIRGLKDWFETYTYVESLVSLNSGTSVGQEQAAWKRHVKNEKKKDKKKDKNRRLKNWFESDTYVESLISLNSDTLMEQEQEAWKRTLKNRKKDFCLFKVI